MAEMLGCAAMRALWSVVVVCLVAASGAGRVEARTAGRAAPCGQQPASLGHPAPSLARAIATAPSLHAVATRSAHRPGARGSERPLAAPALAATPLSLLAPPSCALDRPGPAVGRAAAPAIRTGSARGPPIA